MVNISTKTRERFVSGLKKYQQVLKRAKDKDINESDTVTIIVDMLNDVFGYDKYSEITSEYAIRKTFCDIAIEINGKVSLLVEAKAIGLPLKDDFVKQAVDYGSNSGIDWVVLTNGVVWKVFRIVFSKPVGIEFVYEFDFTELSSKKQCDLEMLFYLSKESTYKSTSNLLNEYAAQKRVMNQFFIGQLLLTEPVINVIKRQIKKISPKTRSMDSEIKDILAASVMKREVLEGEKSVEAKRRISKYERSLKASQHLKKTCDVTPNPNNAGEQLDNKG